MRFQQNAHWADNGAQTFSKQKSNKKYAGIGPQCEVKQKFTNTAPFQVRQ